MIPTIKAVLAISLVPLALIGASCQRQPAAAPQTSFAAETTSVPASPAPDVGAQVSAQPKFDGERAYSKVIDLTSWGHRIIGGVGETRAKAYIRDQFIAAGYDTELQGFANSAGVESDNVVTINSGHGDRGWILVGGHYDTMATKGANDNTSGTAIVLELASMWSRLGKPQDVVFVAFSGEEESNPQKTPYAGSKAYLANLSESRRSTLAGYINIDMVGWPHVAHAAGNLGLSDQWLNTLAHSLARQRGMALAPRGYSTRRSDHSVLEKAGIPTISFGQITYPYLHKESDDVDKVSPAHLRLVGQLVLDMLLSPEVETRLSGES